MVAGADNNIYKYTQTAAYRSKSMQIAANRIRLNDKKMFPTYNIEALQKWGNIFQASSFSSIVSN